MTATGAARILGDGGLPLRALALRRTARAPSQAHVPAVQARFKLVQVLTGVELPCEAVVGRNFRIDHFGDIIVSGYARFGDDCVIRNGVTVGLQNEEEPAAPQMGNNVSIGAGAKVLGPITIGDNVKIGANAVVIRDVPPNSIAVGVPAKVLPLR